MTAQEKVWCAERNAIHRQNLAEKKAEWEMEQAAWKLWDTHPDNLYLQEAVRRFELVQDVIETIRTLKADAGIPQNQVVEVIIVCPN